MCDQILQNFHMISAWCLLRGVSAILHLGPAGGLQERGKDSAVLVVGPAPKTKTATDSTAALSAGSAKTRESTAAAGRSAASKVSVFLTFHIDFCC